MTLAAPGCAAHHAGTRKLPVPGRTGDIALAAIAAEEGFQSSAVTPSTGAVIRGLKDLQPRRLAVMHGSCHRGDCEGQLERLASGFDARLRTRTAAAPTG